jgi:hypothetical protein
VVPFFPNKPTSQLFDWPIKPGSTFFLQKMQKFSVVAFLLASLATSVQSEATGECLGGSDAPQITMRATLGQ